MATTQTWRDEAIIDVDASPATVWALIADLGRMGEWSPVCRRCEWTGGSSHAAVGAQFIGHNRQGPIRWSRRCEITVCDPDRELAFRTLFKGRESTRWQYHLEPTPTLTRVVESYEVVFLPPWVELLHRVPGMHTKARRDGVRNMTHTLERLRAVAEKGSP